MIDRARLGLPTRAELLRLQERDTALALAAAQLRLECLLTAGGFSATSRPVDIVWLVARAGLWRVMFGECA